MKEKITLIMLMNTVNHKKKKEQRLWLRSVKVSQIMAVKKVVILLSNE